MSQYTSYTVTVTNNSTTVTGATGTKFLTNATPGNAFKVKDDPVIYTVASVTSDTVLVLSAAYQGLTAAGKQYQITRDYTPNLGLAEINPGDQDWPIHLTQEVIRKIDTVVATAVGNVATVTSKATNHTLLTTDTGKVVIFTGVATLTLPSPAGFPEGFQCVVWNQAPTAVDVTIAGTYVAAGTKIGQKLAASVLLTGGVWYVAGGIS